MQMQSHLTWRLAALGGLLSGLLLSGCAGIPGNQPVPEPTSGPTAHIRVVTPSKNYGANVNVRGYPGMGCAASVHAGGNILNLAAVAGLIKSRTGQRNDMTPSPQSPDTHAMTEFSVAAGRPFALSLETWWGREDSYFQSGGITYRRVTPPELCARAVTFVPETGRDYEIRFDKTGAHSCVVTGVVLAASKEEVLPLQPTTLCKGMSRSRLGLPSPYGLPDGIPDPNKDEDED